ncbi:MAG: DNA helicase-2/ATP-dependent DNA helicase PcrA [Saprospiraceae bacterium]|jgi:DNA helicase-2/ATP-dependent DNA helicase PcrA
MDNLNKSQKSAAEYEGKHLLVLAGAGTGKTKTIIARAKYLLNSGISPANIQIVTFTKKAAAEIVTRIKSGMDSDSAKGLNGATFHSWCNQLINNYPNVFGTANFTIIDSDDQLSLMKMICGNRKTQYAKLRIKPQKFLDLYSYGRNTKTNLSESIKKKLLDDKHDKEVEKLLAVIKPDVAEILKTYEMKKRQRRYLDYDDMISLVANRLNKDEKARAVISKRYRHLLVDEMQDTNPLQWELLKPFQDQSQLFCVGDDAQSIYSFRGADFKNIHQFEKRVPESKTILLEENYRSTQEILDISNWLLSNSPLEYNKELRAARGSGLKPILINVTNEWDEARYVADTIIDNFTLKDKKYEDHLVLSRSQNYTRSLQAVFIEKKIPFVTYGGRSFMESAHVKDLFSALRVVNNHTDEIAWVRFLTLWEGIGEVTASQYIAELIAKDNVEECIEFFYKNHSKSNDQIVKTLTKVHRAGDDIKKAVEESYIYMKDLLSSKYAGDWESKRQGDFPVLAKLAENYSNLGEFIAECVLDNSTSINNSPLLKQSKIEKTINKDKVIISTVHSAKGLEADTTFVLDVSPKVYPSAWSMGVEEAVEEDRRVLYVALTRAKNHLHITRKMNSITALRHKSDKGKIIESYFFNDLPEALVDQKAFTAERGLFDDIEELNELDFDFGMDFS